MTAFDPDRVAALMGLGWAALVADRLRRAREDARRRRNDCVCDGVALDPEQGWDCWRGRQTYDGGVEDFPREEWCGPCQERQAAHDEYRRLCKELGVARRRVASLAKRVDQLAGAAA